MSRPTVLVLGVILMLGVAAAGMAQRPPCGAINTPSTPSPAGASEVALDDAAPPQAVPQCPDPQSSPCNPPPPSVQPTPPGQPGPGPALAEILGKLDALKAKRQAIDQKEQTLLAKLRQELKAPAPSVPGYWLPSGYPGTAVPPYQPPPPPALQLSPRDAGVCPYDAPRTTATPPATEIPR